MMARKPIYPFELRPYQKECLRSLPETGAFLVQMATGLGKTVCMSRVPRRGRLLILSHRDELVRQPEKYFSCSFGVEQGKEKSNGEEVVSASVQSLTRRLGKFSPQDFDVIITDEAHHAAAKTYRKIYDHFKPRLHVGFTATPNRGDGVRLDDVFEDIVFERDLVWGIQNGWLCDIHCLRVNIGYDISNVAKRMGDFAPGELEKAMNIEAANKAIADAYAEYAKGQTLIFAASVAHAKAIADRIPGAMAVIGGEDREHLVQGFKEGKIPCLVNCMVFTEGTDIPNVETIIIARPTQNDALYTQMVGRGTRLSPGKEKLTLIDCVGVTGKASLCTAPSLIGVDMAEVPEAFRDDVEGDLFDLPEIARGKADVPEAWIQNVQHVNLWAQKKKYNLHNIYFFRMPDGALILSTPKVTIPPEDMMGMVSIGGKRMKTQEAIDSVYRWLVKEHDDKRPLWDLSVVKKWGAYSATEGQKNLIIRLSSGRIGTESLTKMEANLIITRLKYAKSTRHISRKTA